VELERGRRGLDRAELCRERGEAGLVRGDCARPNCMEDGLVACLRGEEGRFDELGAESGPVLSILRRRAIARAKEPKESRGTSDAKEATDGEGGECGRPESRSSSLTA